MKRAIVWFKASFYYPKPPFAGLFGALGMLVNLPRLTIFTGAPLLFGLLSIYRPLRPQPAEAMRVTFSLDLLLFRAT
jgi:hypothetical protein